MASRSRVAERCRAEAVTEDTAHGDEQTSGCPANVIMQVRRIIRTIKCHGESATAGHCLGRFASAEACGTRRQQFIADAKRHMMAGHPTSAHITSDHIKNLSHSESRCWQGRSQPIH